MYEFKVCNKQDQKKSIIRHSYFNFKTSRVSLEEISKKLYQILEESCNSCESN